MRDDEEEEEVDKEKHCRDEHRCILANHYETQATVYGIAATMCFDHGYTAFGWVLAALAVVDAVAAIAFFTKASK